MDKLPVYRWVVGEEDESEVNAVALVDNPAIELNWQAFNSHFVVEPLDGEGQGEFISRCVELEIGNGIDPEQAAAICHTKWEKKGQKLRKFSADKEKRIISGPLMIAGLPIYRNDNGFEYYGVFEQQDIYNIRNKFHRKNYTSAVNKMHDPALAVDGVYMIESFLIDSKRGITAPKGWNLPDGSWFGSYKVDNEEVWEGFIKTGEFKGFSVEGMFREVLMTEQPEDIITQIIEIIKQVK